MSGSLGFRSALLFGLLFWGQSTCCAADVLKEEKLSQWRTVIVGKWKERIEESKTESAGVSFEVIRDIPTGFVPERQRSRLPTVYREIQEMTGEPGDERYLVIVSLNSHTYYWRDLQPTALQQEFLQQIPKSGENDQQRLLEYFWKHQVNEDPTISRISTIALEEASIDGLVQLGQQLREAEVRDRMDRATSEAALFGSLAVIYAASGKELAVEGLRASAINSGSYRNSSRLMIAFLMSAGETGLDELESKLLHQETPYGVGHLIESLNTLLPMSVIPRERLLASLRKCTEEKGFDTLAIASLAHHKDWSMLGSFEERYKASKTPPDLQREIVRYTLNCIADAEKAPRNADLAKEARSKLENLRKHLPKPVTDVEASAKEIEALDRKAAQSPK